jgi:hypothetical protein
MKNDWSRFRLVQAVIIIGLAFVGTLSAFCAPSGKLLSDADVGLAPHTQPVGAEYWVPFIVLVVAACWLFILLWQFWRGAFPASRRRLSRSDDTAVYVKSNCRLCGGSIEFPEHGLGARVRCPHCDEQMN